MISDMCVRGGFFLLRKACSSSLPRGEQVDGLPLVANHLGCVCPESHQELIDGARVGVT